MAILYERSLGTESKWWAYLSTLPDAEPLPLLWTDECLQLLRGTGLGPEEVHERRNLLLQGVRTCLDVAREQLGSGLQLDPTVVAFLVSLQANPDAILAADTLATSRKFTIGGGEEGGKDGGEEVMLPLGDMLNHACRSTGDKGDEDSDESMEEQAHSDQEMENDENDSEPVGGMDVMMCCKQSSVHVKVVTAVVQGAEIFNTYGEFGNAELLQKYGFVVPGNPFDSVDIDHGATVDALQGTGIVPKRQMRRRHSQYTLYPFVHL